MPGACCHLSCEQNGSFVEANVTQRRVSIFRSTWEWAASALPLKLVLTAACVLIYAAHRLYQYDYELGWKPFSGTSLSKPPRPQSLIGEIKTKQE